MEGKNVEVARGLIQLWNEGVRTVPTQYLDPAVELESPFTSLSGAPYRGHAGIEQWVRDVDAHFSEWRTDEESVRAIGSAVIIQGRLHGRGRGSDVELDQPYAMVLDFACENRVTRVRIYWDVGAARQAVGLTE